MSIIFADRAPEPHEIERFRLILSTYQDGSGMLTPARIRSWMARNNLTTIPGWRDFERAVALAFDGKALESKHIYDVLLSDSNPNGPYVGVSCKMRRELRKVQRQNRVTIELSNAAGEFWRTIKAETSLDEVSYLSNPTAVDHALISTVERWHTAVAEIIDLPRSFFLALQWDEAIGAYQLFQFPIDLPDPAGLAWSALAQQRRVVGRDTSGVLFEWYPFSGGQLKYYPLSDTALWQSEEFQLEPLPPNLEHILLNKAASYFPSRWQEIENPPSGATSGSKKDTTSIS
jgi:hypothetical protein